MAGEEALMIRGDVLAAILEGCARIKGLAQSIHGSHGMFDAEVDRVLHEVAKRVLECCGIHDPVQSSDGRDNYDTFVYALTGRIGDVWELLTHTTGDLDRVHFAVDSILAQHGHRPFWRMVLEGAARGRVTAADFADLDRFFDRSSRNQR